MHGCCKEIDGAVGITLRLLFDYYRKKTSGVLCCKASEVFLQNAENLCNHDQTTALRRSGFRLDGLITPTPKAAGSNPVGHTIVDKTCV